MFVFLLVLFSCSQTVFSQTNIPIWINLAGKTGSLGSADGSNSSVRFFTPSALAADTNGNVFIADTQNSRVRSLRPSGSNWVSATLGNPGQYPIGIVADNNSNVYVTTSVSSTVTQYSPSGGTWVANVIAGTAGLTGAVDDTNSAIRFNGPQGIALDATGNLYVADSANYTIRKLTPSGTNWISSTLAGVAGTQGTNDGTNSSARFYFPTALVVDNKSNLYVADSGRYTIRRIAPSGTNWITTTIAGLANSPGTADGTNSGIRFSYPIGMAADNTGSLYVADEGGSTIRKLTPSGTNWVSTTIGGFGIGGQFNQPRGISADGRGLLYVANTGAETIWMGAPQFSVVGGGVTNGIATVRWKSLAPLAYQVQYRTNITQTNWLNLGGAVTATNNAASITDVIGTNLTRFYRVVWLL